MVGRDVDNRVQKQKPFTLTNYTSVHGLTANLHQIAVPRHLLVDNRLVLSCPSSDPCSQVAAHILPVGDPAIFITVNFLYGNVFCIVRRAKLAWLHLVQPCAFLRIQDGGLGHLEFQQIFNL